ncbi:HYR-like domain-containing protein, partial [Chitinophaga lutea]
MTGFTAVNNAALSANAGNISITLPTPKPAAGTYNFSITFTNDKGCDSSQSFQVRFDMPSTIVDVTASETEICKGESTTLTVNGTLGTGATWTWYTGSCGGTAVGTGTSIVVSPAVTTRYYVKGESNSECGNSVCQEIEITVYEAPVQANAGSDLDQCNDGTFQLSGNQPSPAGAQGKWYIVSTTNAASTAAVTNPADPAATITSVAAGETITVRWAIGNGVCDSTYDDVTLYNRVEISNNTITADQVICRAAVPHRLQGSNPQGGSGSYSFLWQISTNGVDFTNISGATGQHYQPGAVSQTTWFRRRVTSASCESYSNPVQIRVSAAVPVVATQPANRVEECVANTDYYALFGTPTFTHADNFPISVTHADTENSTACSRFITRTWTAVDTCGNQTTVSQVIEVRDTRAPVFNLPLPADVAAECSSIPTFVDLTAADECSAVTVTKAERMEATGTCASSYRLIRTWTAKDVCGNTTIHTQTITVTDNTAPVFDSPVPSDITVSCDAIPAQPDITATDNCSPSNQVRIVKNENKVAIPGACANNYLLVRTWTAIDECRNSRTITQTITVIDTTAPRFTTAVPADVTVECNAVPSAPVMQATDNCSGNRVQVAYNQQRVDLPNACANNYQLIRTWTATDECGNDTTVTQTITVRDTQPPVFTTARPADVTVPCNAVPAMPDLTAADNCSMAANVSIVKGERRINGSCANTYQLERTWTATDECGNSAVLTQLINVIDTAKPVFTTRIPADTTVECHAVPAPPQMQATDNCSPAANIRINYTQQRVDIANACASNYKLLRVWTATDECGNETRAMQVITVVDRTAPTFNAAAPVNATVECSAIPAQPDIMATDNCTPANAIRIEKFETRENITGACVNNYRLIRTWVATDECGNRAELKQILTVQDKTAPVFTIVPPTNLTVDCDEVPAVPQMTATDNCSMNNVRVTYGFRKQYLSTTCANNYRLTRTWTATDECGNVATAVQVITVIDTTRPVFNMPAPADMTVECSAIPAPVAMAATDNCGYPGSTKVSYSQRKESIPGACANNYRLIRTWTATDECGNTAVARQIITVTDTTRPVIAPAPADITVGCGQTIPSTMIELTATDNCDASFPKKVKYTVDPYTKDICNGYTIVRRWKVTDACGNAAQDVTQRIIVLPCPKPALEPAVTVNCQTYPFITLKTKGTVNRPTFTLVGVTPANAVPTPVTSTNPRFNINGATTASFIVRDGITGCVSDTVTYRIDYTAMPMVNLGPDSSVCGGNGMVLDAGAANAGYNIRWSTGETSQRIRVTKAGRYIVTVSNGLCAASDTINVSVIPMPLVNLPDTTICRGQSITLNAAVTGATYLWSTGATTPSIIAGTQEQFWVRVTKNGCITIDTVNVTVVPPPDVTLSRDTTLCPGQSVMLTVTTDAGRIQWATGETSNSIVVSRAGTYAVSVYRDNCVVKEEVRVTNRPDIQFDLGPDRIICPGGSILIDARHPDAAAYRWNDGDVNPVKAFTESGLYILGILDKYCDRFKMDSINVTVAGAPTISLGNDTTLCLGRRHIIKSKSTNATSYRWSTGATTSYIEVTQPGTYTVTAYNDCGSATDDIVIDFKACDSRPDVPNAFSPNGDGKNDIFRPVVRGPMYDYELRIFNRWGELLFMSRDPNEGWDGTYKGQPVDVGTYVWWLSYKKTNNGPSFVIKGDVVVVR